MKFYEPFQRLDLAGYNKTENAVYVKSTVTAYLPAKATLLGKDPILGSTPGTASIDYYYQLNESALVEYTFEQVRLIKVLDRVLNDREIKLSGKELTTSLNNAVKAKLGSLGVYSVACKVINDSSAVGGQVTTTIAQTGNVTII